MRYKRVDMIFKEYLQGAIERLEREHRGIDESIPLDTSEWDMKYHGNTRTLTLASDKDWYVITDNGDAGLKLVNIAGLEIPIATPDKIHIRAFINRIGEETIKIPRMTFNEMVEALKRFEEGDVVTDDPMVYFGEE